MRPDPPFKKGDWVLMDDRFFHGRKTAVYAVGRVVELRGTVFLIVAMEGDPLHLRTVDFIHLIGISPLEALAYL